jgi:hypothetical protein
MLNRLIAKGAYMRKQVSQCQKRLEGCWGGAGEGGREGGWGVLPWARLLVRE